MKFLRRTAAGSSCRSLAIRSIVRSRQKAASGPPAPRYAPVGGLLVMTDRNEIPPPHCSWIQLQVSGDQVYRALQAEGCFRAPGPPIRPGGRFIGDDRSE